MKTILLCLLSLFIIPVQSCKTFDPNSNAAQTSLNYIRPLTFLTAKMVFESAVSDSDRVKKAQVLQRISGIIKGLTVGEIPTPEQLKIKISDASPDKEHWELLSIAISDIYKSYYSNITSTDKNKYAVEVLNRIADGCESAANSILLQ